MTRQEKLERAIAGMLLTMHPLRNREDGELRGYQITPETWKEAKRWTVKVDAQAARTIVTVTPKGWDL